MSNSGLPIFIMIMQDLQKGGELLPAYLSSGSMVAFKSTLFNLREGSARQWSCLGLFSKNGDIILWIIFKKGQKKKFLNDCRSKSLLDGWGKERSADLDVNVLRYQGTTIAVYNFLADFRITRYQILVKPNHRGLL